MEKIAVLTSGGDAPGMNAALRAVVRSSLARGITVFGFRRGYDGLIADEGAELSSIHVGGVIAMGGTVLRSARSKEFHTETGREQAAANLSERGISGLIVIGGDGSLRGADVFSKEHEIKVVGIPASIDNDIPCTDSCIGFDTAVNTALDAIDRVRDTAYSHERVFVIEVMGRNNGHIAVESGLAGGAEAILVPEIPFSLPEICHNLKAGYGRGKRSSIIVVAEGAASAMAVCDFIEKNTDYEARYLVLGHMQRGGKPTALDRVLGTRFGSAAVDSLVTGENRCIVSLQGVRIVKVPFETVFMSSRVLDPERLKLAEVMAQ